jgi:hypothetical protein
MIARGKWLAANSETPVRLALLISCQLALCCVSLVYTARFREGDYFDATLFHIFYDPARLGTVVAVVAAFAPLSILFAFGRFSFGYFVAFYLYSMIFSYLWINCFSTLEYDHRLGGISAAVSAIVFLVPALFIRSPIRQRFVLSNKILGRLLMVILLFAAATVAVAAGYNFRLVGIEDIYNFREGLKFPGFISYSLGITSNALLPFAFACFIARKNYWLAGAVLLLLLLYYPITLSKLALFTPVWLVAMALLARFVEARTAVILSLLLPLLAGVLLVLNKSAEVTAAITDSVRYFYTVNFRIIAVPAAAMDVYSDFFSRHDLTHFCQISVLKWFVSCAYQDQMSIVMERAYKLGNFNASLFATEGIASMGLWLAPIAVFGCGLVIALGNRLSAGLPPGFVLISGAVFPQVLLNVPLSVALLTHGAAILFLLWYVTPRTIFHQDGVVASRYAPARIDDAARQNSIEPC